MQEGKQKAKCEETTASHRQDRYVETRDAHCGNISEELSCRS